LKVVRENEFEEGKMKKDEILRKIKNEIVKAYPSATIILYGSRARGDYRECSDWDLLILLNEEISFNQKLALNDKLFAIELEVSEVLIPIIHHVNEWENLKATPFYENVQREGIRI
jgi:predicted nucleotidyltransferase